MESFFHIYEVGGAYGRESMDFWTDYLRHIADYCFEMECQNPGKFLPSLMKFPSRNNRYDLHLWSQSTFSHV